MYVQTYEGLGQPTRSDTERAVHIQIKPKELPNLQNLKNRFTYPFWNLPEGKSATQNVDGSFTFEVNGVTIHMLPDRLLTEEEFKKEGNTFKYDNDERLARAEAKYGYKKINFDPSSIQYMQAGNERMVTDYREPTFEISIQVFYRKSKRASTLAKARSLRSAYGRGQTLRGHESWHVADAIDYIRRYRPTLPDMRGLLEDDINRALRSYYDAVQKIGTAIERYSEAKTDCIGRRKASFCK
jgi:hypothetical protein